MLFAALVALVALALADDIIVLKQGQLRGHRLTSRKGRQIFAYQGIPYAKPPIAELRFKPPQTPEPWEGVLDATKDGSECIQRDFDKPEKDVKGKEDCLYLNVYTTQEPGVNGSNLDVMFWIHGGAWVSGSGGSDQFGPQYLLDKDVVLVSINYRLGAFGFLSTGDKECPGNNGMKDQVAALRWVRDNIATFGGNPNSVTIFGESAGGASTHYHLLSPMSRGLFHRVISESGTALVNWAFAPNGSTIHHTRKLANLLNCPTESSNVLLSCLRKKNSDDIANADRAFMEWEFHPMIPFNLVVETQTGEKDEAFISLMPREAILNFSNHIVPWMVGLTSGEGAIDVTQTFRNSSLVEDFDQHFDEIVPMSMFFRETALPTEVKNIVQKIRKFYFGNLPVNNDTWLAFRNFYTDGFIFHGTNEAVQLHSQKEAPVYYYYFDYRGTNSYSSMFMDGDYGVCHQDELLYLFPQDHLFPNTTRTQEDDQMVDLLTTLWTNFAHSGNPTPEQKDIATWQPVSSPNDLEYAHITSDKLHMEHGLLKNRADFWASLPLRAKDSLPKKPEL